jgi:hypothetical protein
MQQDCNPIPIDVMHNQVKHKVKLQNKRQGHWLDAPGLTLITIMLASSRLDACGPPNTLWACFARNYDFGSTGSNTKVQV